MHAMFAIFRTNLKEIRDFYHGANMGAGSPKAVIGTH
jgi:hypothetical protein